MLKCFQNINLLAECTVDWDGARLGVTAWMKGHRPSLRRRGNGKDGMDSGGSEMRTALTCGRRGLCGKRERRPQCLDTHKHNCTTSTLVLSDGHTKRLLIISIKRLGRQKLKVTLWKH
jgi:hypothetical protein